MSDETTPENQSEIKAVKIGIVLLCIVIAVICIVTPIIGAYNALVDSDLQVQRSAANIKVDLERRADLLPNLAETVKGSAKFEHDTVVETIMARAGESEAIREHIKGTTDASELAADQSQLTQILGNFVKLQEQYPVLQTTQQFREFSAQVTATENEILVDRQTYNAAVMQYRSVVSSFPTNLMANQYGFNVDRYKMYEPVDMKRAETVPTITFDFANL